MMTGIRHAQAATAIGDLLLTADGDVLTGIYFPGHWHPPAAHTLGRGLDPDETARDQVFAATVGQLGEYLDGNRTAFDLPVRADGDEFSRRVWALLLDIDYGTTTTYGALADHLGNRHLAQRVGQCVGRNPVSIVIPCHRVVGSDGSLTGYAGGLERKRHLLDLEESAEARAARLF